MNKAGASAVWGGPGVAKLVEEALRGYFEDLNGTDPVDLHRLVLCEVEKPLLRMVMDYTGGNCTRAASLLGINRNTLRRKIQQYGLDD